MMAMGLSPAWRGELLHDEPLSRHTSWRVGGPARSFYRPADSADLALFLQQLPPDEPLLWLGLGSNLLVRDGGFQGTVVATQGALIELGRESGDRIRAEAGVPCAKVARFAARQGLIGAGFLSGIPGTMGGALAMNAGAFGGETWERVQQVETIDRYGRIRAREPEEFEIGYREVKGPSGEWFVAVRLQLRAGDSAQARQEIRELLQRRGNSQPTQLPSCGSVFRNPAGDHAARLIEAAGLKGARIGGAQVSEKHANFIVNRGQASADDIERLIEHVQAVVEKQSGITLHPEVHMVGDSR
jgi:UDP-N-acetylmuramate dehydrogenase